jgi:hypothetical protein
MASVRSISASKPPERLLTRRLNRASTSTIPAAQRKLTINKTTPITTSTSRQKSPRISVKPGLVASITSPARLNSCNTVTPTNSLELPTDQMASMKLQDLPPIRSRSRISDPTNNSISQINPTNEKHNDMNESLSSLKSSLSNIQYTLESFETIRTVGTGKNFRK